MSLDFAEKLSHTENVGTVGMSEIPTSSFATKSNFQYFSTYNFGSNISCVCYFIIVCECSCILVISYHRWLLIYDCNACQSCFFMIRITIKCRVLPTAWILAPKTPKYLVPVKVPTCPRSAVVPKKLFVHIYLEVMWHMGNIGST